MKSNDKGRRLGKKTVRAAGVMGERARMLEALEGRLLLSGEIFVVNYGNGSIGEFAPSGAAVNASLIAGLNNPIGVAVAGGNLFVTNHGAGTVSEYTTGGALVNATLISGLNNATGIAVSGTDLYVVSYGGQIGHYTTAGATINASLVSVVGGEGIAISGSNLFLANAVDNVVSEYTTSGVTVNASLITGLRDPFGIAVTGSSLYVMSLQSSSSGEYTTSGATVNAALITGTFDGMAIAGQNLYLTSYVTGAVGQYTLTGGTVNAALITGLSNPIALAVVAPTQLAFTQQPADVLAGKAGGPIMVAVEDASGNVNGGDGSAVTLSIASGPAGGAIGGTVTATAVNGVATFSGLSFSVAGLYTLQATGGAGAAVSTQFTATAGYVDSANMNQISGWAFDPANPTAAVQVQVVIDGGPAPQTVLANQSRPDLVAGIGSAGHGFTYATPVLSAGSHTVNIFAIEQGGSRVLLGTRTLVSQNSLFDEHYYLATNPDVAAAVAAGSIATGYDHFVAFGQFEGRRPSANWDEAGYLAANPDIATAVGAHQVSSGFMHYYLYGQREHRGGLTLFDTSYYLAHNPDVAAAVTAGSFSSAFEHFMLFGQYEGRRATA